MQPWSDKNRFHPSPQHKPVIFPQASNYRNLQLFLIDVTLATHQEQKRRQAGFPIADELESRIFGQLDQLDTAYTHSMPFDVI